MADNIGTDLRDADWPKVHRWTWMSVDDFERGIGFVVRRCEKCGVQYRVDVDPEPDERCLPLPQSAE
jgi:hypothetical protein